MSSTEDNDRVGVAVLGVPWLSDDQRAELAAISPRLDIAFVSRSDLENGELPLRPPTVLLAEASYDDESHPHMLPAGLVNQLITPALRWVQTASAGVEHIEGVYPDSVVITNGAGLYAPQIAETAIAGILIHAKRLRERWQNQTDHKWEQLECTELSDKVVGIVGVGGIGSAVAARAKCLGMEVIGMLRTPRAISNVDVVLGPTDVVELLKRADYAVIACPNTAETAGLIGESELRQAKPGSYMILLSRGRIVSEKALLQALNSGVLSGALIDAFWEEPLPPTHPLWDAPGVTVIPHDSSSSPNIGAKIVDLFSENLKRFLAGDELRNVVDLERGY